MARPITGKARLKPMTVKVDPELKTMTERMASHELRSPSSCAAVLLQLGLLRWYEAGNLQPLIDEIDKGWPKTIQLRRDLAKAR